MNINLAAGVFCSLAAVWCGGVSGYCFAKGNVDLGLLNLSLAAVNVAFAIYLLKV